MEVDEREQPVPMGDLVTRISDDAVRLVRDEIHLARVEMTAKAKAAGVGVGLFGGAGVFAVYGLGVLIAAAVIGLSMLLAPWAAALIVAGALLTLAGVAALMGKKGFERVGQPLPTEAIQNTKEDVYELKQGLHR